MSRRSLRPWTTPTRTASVSPRSPTLSSPGSSSTRALPAAIGPTVNSYKRAGAAISTRSGATWSPRRAGYGGNDRTHFIRIPEGNRIELRGGDGSANPYLAAATVLTAGLDGITRELDPGEPSSTSEDCVELLPTLLHAVDALTADPVVCGALDAVGEAAIAETLPHAPVIGCGKQLAVLKGVGHPNLLAAAFGLASVQGWQAVAHTRMATESAVTAAGSHPFSVGADQCLVHNGS